MKIYKFLYTVEQEPSLDLFDEDTIYFKEN